MARNGRFYAMPYNGLHVLKWEDAIERYSLISGPPCQSACYFGAVMATGGRYLYGIPHSHSAVMKIDTDMDKVTTLPGSLSGEFKWAGGLRSGSPSLFHAATTTSSPANTGVLVAVVAHFAVHTVCPVLMSNA